MLKRVSDLAIGSGAAGIGGAKNPHHRFAERCGNVHRTRVIRDHDLAQTRPLDHLRERRAAGEIDASIRDCLGDHIAERLVGSAAKDRESDVTKSRGKFLGECDEIFRRPALVQPART